MQAVKRHEVVALMGEVHKAAGNVAVSALTKQVKRLMRGRPGIPAEKRAENVKQALALVHAAKALTEEPAAVEALGNAVVLLSAAVALGEPESKHAPKACMSATEESNPVEEFFGGMLPMPKA